MDAGILRVDHDPKARRGWFSTATKLPPGGVKEAEIQDLLTDFPALYSFDGLDFGPDTLLHLAKATEDLEAHMDIFRRSWGTFASLTGLRAVRAMEVQAFLS